MPSPSLLTLTRTFYWSCVFNKSKSGLVLVKFSFLLGTKICIQRHSRLISLSEPSSTSDNLVLQSFDSLTIFLNKKIGKYIFMYVYIYLYIFYYIKFFNFNSCGFLVEFISERREKQPAYVPTTCDEKSDLYVDEKIGLFFLVPVCLND